MEKNSMKSETYIILKNDEILKVYKTTQSIQGVHQSLKNQKISDYSDIKRVDKMNDYRPKTNINEYDKNGIFKPMETRIIDGYRPAPKGKKIVNNTIVDKTIFEQLRDGEIKMSPFQKYDEINDEIIDKTEEEIEAEMIAKMSKEELSKYNKQKELEAQEKLIQDEIRKIAIERLQAEGIIPINYKPGDYKTNDN
jgi:hypothetical protein